MVYIIDFDCHWNRTYPKEHTIGQVMLSGENDLTAITFIYKRFLCHPDLVNYHFIIDNGVDCFEIKKEV